MKIIEWKDKNSWNQFVADNSHPASFLQSWEWGEFQKNQGQEALRLGFIPAQTREHESGELLAVVSLIKRCLPIYGMCFWYISRGPIIKKDNLGSQEAFVRQLVDYIGENNHIFLRMIPNWQKQQNHVDWKKLGFEDPSILAKQREPEMTLLNKLQDPEAMLASMHQKTRYNIRLANRKGVKFRLYESGKDLKVFWDLLNTTANREKIRIYKKDYYTVLMIATRLVTSMNQQTDPSRLRSIMAFATLNKKPLATGLWLGFGDTLTYLHGGSSREEKQVMAPYALHWQMMQWAKNRGYQIYDWWGIEKPGSVFHFGGVSRFKRGFGGAELEFAGTYDHVYHKKTLKYLKMLKKIKEIF